MNLDLSKKMKVASRNEINIGKAYILSALDEGVTKKYEVEIEKIFLNNNENNKSMLLKVNDKSLIEKTGGIIQGMSGSPLIQNEKFIRVYNKCFGKRSNTRICYIC